MVKETKITYIYGLCEGSNIKYIGKSDSPLKRKEEHLYEAKRNNKTHKENMKRTKNLKITPKTHKLLKEYCEENGLKMFAFVEKLIKDKCSKPKDLYGE